MATTTTTSHTVEATLDEIRNILNKRAPLIAGVLPVKEESLSMFFKKDQSGHCLDAFYISFPNANEEQLTALFDACQPATFGLNDKDVFDETYRKAGKLDRVNFATKLGAELPRLIELIESHLLDGKRRVRAELYKLNTYGEGSFFKPHKDTPREGTMFGSLVIAFPTPHTGGALVFRNQGREWTVDAGQDLARAGKPNTISYAAFFSDVEHEVLPITSGHRVTITYNLHWLNEDGDLSDDSDDNGDRTKAGTQTDSRDGPTDVTLLTSQIDADVALRVALGRVLADPTFLPHGGWMGFGLRHQYRNDFVPRAHELKGADAVLERVLSSLEPLARPTTKVIYDSVQHYGEYDEESVATFMLDKVPNAGHQIESFLEFMSWQKNLKVKQIGGEPQDLSEYDYWHNRSEEKEKEDDKREFMWVTELTKAGRQDVPYVAYGNEASLSSFYVDLCLVVEVGPPGSRKVEPVDQQ